MKEEILHFIWKFQLITQPLFTIENEKVEVIEQGVWNHNSGPDFLNAKIKIGDTIWAGNVEIHINSADWFLHKHQFDKAYDNVILHVVFYHDMSVIQQQKLNIPTLELSNNIQQGIIENYQNLKNSSLWIPCYQEILKVDPFVKNLWIERLLVERLEQRSDSILSIVQLNQNDWLESFYQYLARSFGFKVNNDAFFELAKSLPLKILAKHSNDIFQLEALLFGQSGLINDYLQDEYPAKLFMEYKFLRKKYGLNPLSPSMWKFGKIRPSNFPTIRISQFANLLFKSKNLFSKIIEVNNLEGLYKLFDFKASNYWDSHYSFEKFSLKRSPKKLGKSSIDNLIINTIVPFLFVYGKEKNDVEKKDKSLELLTSLPSENNNIIEKWRELDFEIGSAATTQSLIFLKQNYCDNKKCLQCNIGAHILMKKVL